MSFFYRLAHAIGFRPWEAEQRREASLSAEREARENAERLGRLKDEFLATVSHELRTPLNAILGWSQLLGRREMPSEEARRAVETIRRNARAQAVLIDDLLDMNRIVSGKLRLEMHPMDLTVAVAAAIESIEPALRAVTKPPSPGRTRSRPDR